MSGLVGKSQRPGRCYAAFQWLPEFIYSFNKNTLGTSYVPGMNQADRLLVWGHRWEW